MFLVVGTAASRAQRSVGRFQQSQLTSYLCPSKLRGMLPAAPEKSAAHLGASAIAVFCSGRLSGSGLAQYVVHYTTTTDNENLFATAEPVARLKAGDIPTPTRWTALET